MAVNGAKDSHISQKGSMQPDESAGVRQHHLLATGKPITGQTNPNGGAPSTKNMIANNQGKTY